MIGKTMAAIGVAAALLSAQAASALVVSSLPYQGTPDWTDIVFSETSMTLGAGRSDLSTNQYRGVWFGWGAWYGDQPGWTPGSNAVGNYLSLSLSFSAGAADWNAYFYDRTAEFAMQFNPTVSCPGGNCYGQPVTPGVMLYFGNPTPGGALLSTFVALDTTQVHRYEALMRGTMLTYRIDGIAYSGLAIAQGLAEPLLVIGDGSGSSPTGVGQMTVHGVQFDTAPSFSALPGVPEPQSWALLLAGFGLAGAALRRQRTLAAA